MNIAHLLPYSARFPLKKHNGRYDWVLRLAKLQVSQGHTVTVYAAPGSYEETETIHWRSIPEDFENKLMNNVALIKKALQNPQHDIYHSHFDYLHYFLADTTSKPVVYTQHWFPTQIITEAHHYNIRDNVFAIPVTKYMHEENKRLGIPTLEKIYHGIDLATFKPLPGQKENRLIFVGRVAEHKGVREAIKIAKAANENLDIVGKVNPVDNEYWNSLLPFVDGQQIRYLGALPQEKVSELLSRAKAFLFPNTSNESFGQVTIEAQACGTPVLISGVGASNELIQEGVTGFTATSEAGFLAAIKHLDTINPAACRAFAEQFDVHTMANQYEAVYNSLLSGR